MSGWGVEQPADPTDDWVIPTPAAEVSRPMVRTGPSGLLLGTTTDAQRRTSPLTVRLFRNRPTRVFLAVPEYVGWLVTYRAISLGAHLSVMAQDHRRWGRLAHAVRASGGTIDLLQAGERPPGSGRPYRPSLVVDDTHDYDGSQVALGPWQAALVHENAAASGAIFPLRSCDMALVGPCDARVGENLRRAYALSARQVKECAGLSENEVVLAMPRRLMRVQIPPTPTEYEVLFRS